MTVADLKVDSKSPERGTSSCVAPGFNPGRVYETNGGLQISNPPAEFVPEFVDRNEINGQGFNPARGCRNERCREFWDGL